MPCKDVSKLNKNRSGAFGQHSGLHELAAKFRVHLESLTKNFVFTCECTKMDDCDKASFSAAFKVEPIEMNNRGWSPLSRPRLWWIGGKDPVWPANTLHGSLDGAWLIRPKKPKDTWERCLLPGYTPCALTNSSEVCFKCLTTRTPKHEEPVEAVGKEKASAEALQRWAEDKWSQAPYQYEETNMVQDTSGNIRRLLPCEEEKLMGYPQDYTAVLKKAAGEDHKAHAYRRQTLLGNSWSLHVTLFIVQSFIIPHVKSNELCGDSPFQDMDPQSFEWGRNHCPYLRDLQERDVPQSQSLPPDWSEMHANLAGGLAEKVQSRKHTPWHLGKNSSRYGPVSSLPKGLPPQVHFKAGCLADSPVDEELSIPDDLDFAIRTTISLGRKADAWRRGQLKAMRPWLSHAIDLENHWQALRSDSSFEVAPNVRPHAFDLLGHSIKWPDISLPAMMAVGALPLGRQETTGVFRQKQSEASVDPKTFLDECSAFMESLKKRQPPRADQAKIIFDLSTKEQENGLLSPWRTEEFVDAKYGKGNWRALPRYAIQQGEKWRLIDNGRAGEHNATYEAGETIHTTCTSAGVSMASRFRKILGKPLRKDYSLCISTQDMWKAYRQIPCHPDQIKFMIIIAWHPSEKKWVYGETKALLFGLTGAVLAFNRVPTFIVALARRWLAIPVQNFFDDFRITDLEIANGSANRFLCLLVQEVLGLVIDAGKEQPPSHKAVFLGNIEQYKVPGEADAMMVAPKPGRSQSINALIVKALAEMKLTPGDAKTLRGKIIHYASACAGRVAKGILHFINEQAMAQRSEWSEGLMFNLLFLQQLLTLTIPRIIPLNPVHAKRARIWTDASFHVDSAGIPICKLCGIISTQGMAPEGFVATVPPSLIASFQERKQQIHMGELLAPVCSILQWKQAVTDASLIFYIDNMGVLCNIVNGSAKQLDAGTVTFALHLQLAALRSSAWWEWVESESNCSDGGSRVGVTCPVAKSLGITLKEIQFPAIPNHFMRMTPLEWARFWEEQSN